VNSLRFSRIDARGEVNHAGIAQEPGDPICSHFSNDLRTGDIIRCYYYEAVMRHHPDDLVHRINGRALSENLGNCDVLAATYV